MFSASLLKRLDYIFKTKRSLQRKINVTKGPKRETLKVLHERFQRIKSFNYAAYVINSIRPPTAFGAFTDEHAEVVQEVI